jgi:hypothetical protein
LYDALFNRGYHNPNIFQILKAYTTHASIKKSPVYLDYSKSYGRDEKKRQFSIPVLIKKAK